MLNEKVFGSFIEKNDNIFFKFQRDVNGTVQTKTITLDSLYSVLGKILKKEDLVYDTGVIPKNLVKIAETTNSLEFYYHYDQIIYDFTATKSFNFFGCPSIETESSNIVKNLILKDVVVKITLSKDSNTQNRCVIYLYNPYDNPFKQDYTDHARLNILPFCNIFSDGRICWGHNSRMEALYETKYLMKDVPPSKSELYNIYYNLPYDFLSSMFNGDLISCSFFRFLNSEILNYKQDFIDFYNKEVFEELLYSLDVVAAPLILNFLYNKPDIASVVFNRYKHYQD